MNKKILTLAIAAVPLVAMAESPVVTRILDGNPTLTALKAVNTADVAVQRAENSLPGPEAEFEHMWGVGAENKWSAGISQSFDWPGVYKARSRAADAADRAGQLTYMSRYRDIRLEACQLIIRYQFASQRLELVNEMIDDLTKIGENLDVALEHGLVTILDAKKASIELANLGIERDKIANERQSIRGLINELAGRTIEWTDDELGSAVLASTGSFESLDSYLDTALKSDMSLAAAAAAATADRQRAAAMRASLAPSFSVGYRHAFEEGHHFNGFAVSVGLPSWGFKSYRTAAKATELAATQNVETARAALYSRVSSDYSRAELLRKNIMVMRNSGLDGNYLSLIEQAYRGGELSAMDYLREQSYYREARLATLDLEEEYALVLASLNRYLD